MTLTNFSACLVTATAILLPDPTSGQEFKKFHPLADVDQKADVNQKRNFRYQRYFTRDEFSRKITFYLSKTKSVGKLPMVVCIQGSGCQSLFLEIDTSNGKVIASGGPEAVIAGKFHDQVRVLVVEKPGVEFLFQPERPGSALDATDEYNREFSLPRWTAAISAAVRAALKLDGVDGRKVMTLGHSEGGQVACEVAAALPKNITHVAVMAGGGPTQMYDLIEFAKSGDLYDPNATAEERYEMLMKDWNKVADNPLAHDKFILGHSHLRWSSFLKTSPIEALNKTNAKVYIAQGTDDKNSLPASADVLYAEMLARGRICRYDRVKGGDHAFMSGNDSKGWELANTKAVDWFLQD